MSNVIGIALNYITKNKEIDTELFINGKLCTNDFLNSNKKSIKEYLLSLDENMILERVNLDCYLTEYEKQLFLNDLQNCKILPQEQDAILEGDIDYAFDMIADRLVNNDDNDNKCLCKAVAAELERYQDMTQEVLDYILLHQEVKEIQDVYDIIKKWAC